MGRADDLILSVSFNHVSLSLCMKRVLIYVLKILLAQAILNASAGSGGNNEANARCGIILNFLKIGTYGCR